MKAIYTAFVKAQKSFDEAIKSSKNPFFKSEYAGLPECIDAVLPHLHANGIAVIQPTHECDDGVIVETIFIHESGEQISGGKLHVPAAKNDPQAYGSALTYARRYSLSSACSIKTADDDGNAASKKKDDGRPFDQIDYARQLRSCTTLTMLQNVFADMPKAEQKKHVKVKDEMKAKLQEAV